MAEHDTKPVRAKLCAECKELYMRWLDHRLVIRPRFAAAAAYDSTPKGVRDNRNAAYESWRKLVREQCQAIRGQCVAEHQPGQLAFPGVAA